MTNFPHWNQYIVKNTIVAIPDPFQTKISSIEDSIH